jgi:hypothetical protein
LKGTPVPTSRKRARFDVTVKSASYAPVKKEFNLAITVKDKPSLRTSKWLWLAVIFVTSAFLRKTWNKYCLSHIQFG